VSRLKGVLALLLMLLMLRAALALIAAALPLEGMDWLIPAPENTAEQFVSALAAHRYEGAMNSLAQELRRQTREEDLAALVQAIEDSPRRGIQDARGLQSDEQGDTATATVEVKYGNNQTGLIEVPLKKENQVWRVTSLDPLRLK